MKRIEMIVRYSTFFAAFFLVVPSVLACTQRVLSPTLVSDQFDVVLHNQDRPAIGLEVVVKQWNKKLGKWKQVASSPTDASGIARFTGIAAGSYYVSTNTPVENDSQEIEVTADPQRRPEKKLSLWWPPEKVIATRNFNGNLTSYPDVDEPSKPLDEVKVTAFEAYSGKVVGVSVTDKNGKFEIKDLPPGLYFIRLYAEDNPPEQARFYGHKLDGNIVVEYNPLALNTQPTMLLHVAMSDCNHIMYNVVN